MSINPVLTFSCPNGKCRSAKGGKAVMMSYRSYLEEFKDDPKGMTCRICGRELELSTPLDEELFNSLGIEIRKI